MSTIYVPSTAPSTSSVDTRASSVTYPSPFQSAPPRPLRRRLPFDYDDLLDPMFDSKYRRNYERVHRGQHALCLYNPSIAHEAPQHPMACNLLEQ
jgi:hypothetical protein